MTTQKRRPLGRDGASQTHRAAAEQTLPAAADNRAPEAFLAELLRLAEPCGPVPLYGDPEWCALPAGDPRRWASAARAAEAWRRDGTPAATEARLRAELCADDRLAVWRLRQVSLDVSGALPWGSLPEVLVPLTELKRRRGDVA